MKTVVIVQARMASTRLPGKVLREVLGKPLLSYLAERMQRVSLADNLVIATTTNPEDDAIVAFCNQLSLQYYRGPDVDVLARYYEAAVATRTDTVIRVCSDSPLTDPTLVDELITFYRDNSGRYEYVSNSPPNGSVLPLGMGAEVFSFRALEAAHGEALRPEEREHVTPYIWQHPERFGLGFLECGENNSHHRWTVDTPADFQLIKNMLETLYPTNPQFTYADILKVLEDNPTWVNINAQIQQKTV